MDYIPGNGASEYSFPPLEGRNCHYSVLKTLALESVNPFNIIQTSVSGFLPLKPHALSKRWSFSLFNQKNNSAVEASLQTAYIELF
jgi:hypothetical protein